MKIEKSLAEHVSDTASYPSCPTKKSLVSADFSAGEGWFVCLTPALNKWMLG